MQEPANTLPATAEQTAFVEKLFSAAHTRAVFSDAVTAGEYTVITASEVMAGGGFGSGHGFGPATKNGDSGTPSPAGGGGSGGGGASSGRPVAVIVVGPDGVQVKPILDVTKFGLAVLTAWAALLMNVIRIRSAIRKR